MFSGVSGVLGDVTDLATKAFSGFGASAAKIANFAVGTGISYGVSYGLQALGVNPEISGFFGGLAAGAFVGATSEIKGVSATSSVGTVGSNKISQVTRQITRSEFMQSTLMSSLAISQVGNIGVDLGFDPEFTSIISLGASAISGFSVTNPNATYADVIGKVGPNIRSSLAGYGLNKLSSSLGIDELGLAGGILISGIHGGLGGANLTGVEAMTMINEAVTKAALSYGISYAATEITDDAALQALTRRGLAGAIEGVLNPDETIVSGILDGYVQSFGSLVGVTPHQMLSNAIDFGQLLTSSSLADAFESYAVNIFDRQTIESIQRVGGFAAALISPKIDHIMPDGTVVQQSVLSDGTSVLFQNNSFVGIRQNGVYQLGSFGLNEGLTFGLKEGKTMIVNTDQSFYIQEVKGGMTVKSTLFIPGDDDIYSTSRTAERTIVGNEVRYTADLTGDGNTDITVHRDGDITTKYEVMFGVVYGSSGLILDDGTFIPGDMFRNMKLTATHKGENQYDSKIEFTPTFRNDQNYLPNTDSQYDETEFTPALSMFVLNTEGVANALRGLFAEHADFVPTISESDSVGIDALQRLGNVGKEIANILAIDKIKKFLGSDRIQAIEFTNAINEVRDITLYDHERSTFRRIAEFIDSEFSREGVKIITDPTQYNANCVFDCMTFKFGKNIITQEEARLLNENGNIISDALAFTKIGDVLSVLAGYLRSQPYDGTQTDYKVLFDYEFLSQDGQTIKRRFKLDGRVGSFKDQYASEGGQMKTGVIEAELVVNQYNEDTGSLVASAVLIEKAPF